MFEGFGNLVTALFEGLNLRRRWVAILGFVILITFCLLIFEQTSGTIYYNSLGRKVEILKELNALEKEGTISSYPELKRTYDTTVEELNLRTIQPFNFSSIALISSITFWKVISGAAPAVGFMVFFILQKETDIHALFGAIIFAILGGFIGGLLPVIYNPWINYIGFPIAQGVFLNAYGKRE
jgi:hypothetical protein